MKTSKNGLTTLERLRKYKELYNILENRGFVIWYNNKLGCKQFGLPKTAGGVIPPALGYIDNNTFKIVYYNQKEGNDQVNTNPTLITFSNIHKELKKVLNTNQISNHCSDLYCEVNEQSKKIIANYERKEFVTTFKDNISGNKRYDIPFAFKGEPNNV